MKLDTLEGMAEAKKWTAEFISHLNEGGIWGIPRSNSGYRIWNEIKKYECIANGEECVERVLEELGYSALNGSTIEGETG